MSIFYQTQALACRFAILIAFLFLSSTTSSAQVVIFEDDFESGTLSPEWTPQIAIAGDPDGIVEIDGTLGADGGSAVVLARATDGVSTTNALDLSLDLSAYTQVEMQFDFREIIDENDPGEGIYFSDDNGANFTLVIPFDTLESARNTWLNPLPYDVDGIAAGVGLSLNSTFVIRIQQTGTRDIFGGFGSDGIVIDNVRITDPQYVHSTLPFVDDFESGLNRSWRRVDSRDPDVGGATSVHRTHWGAYADTTSANSTSGTHSLLLGRSFDGDTTSNALDLLLDLSGESDVELNFNFAEIDDNVGPEEGLYFSDDGGANFTFIRTFDQTEVGSNYWLRPPPIDLDAIAAAKGLSLSSTFVVRFQQLGTRDRFGAFGADGFLFDDVSVTVPDDTYVTLPYVNTFTEPLGPEWKLSDGFDPQVAIPTSTFAPRWDWRVDTLNAVGPNGENALIMARRTDGPENSNSLDLFLDLDGETDVELNFDFLNVFDNVEPGEGIYFSDDGGANFTFIRTFDTEEYVDNVWVRPPPLDLDAIAISKGLSLTSEFVIRLQQIGDDDILSAFGSDGFMFANFSVTVPDDLYTSPPYFNDFEAAELGPEWRLVDGFDPAVGMPTAPDTTRWDWNAGPIVIPSVSGTQSLLLGRRHDGPESTNSLDLFLDLTGETDVDLSFSFQNVSDDIEPGEGIYFSDDNGQTFTFVYSFDIPDATPGIWYSPSPIDVDALAAANLLTLNDSFVIRFQQTGDDDILSAFGADGYLIDDLAVRSSGVTYPTLPYLEDFEGLAGLGAEFKLVDGSDPAIGQTTTTTPPRYNAYADTSSAQAQSGTHSLLLGRRVDGPESTNSLDLHLDLSLWTDVSLNFNVFYNAEQSEGDEGVYLSTNGGTSFTLIIPFDGAGETNGVWIPKTFNLVDMAAVAGLQLLTQESILRFQQTGDDDILSAFGADGIFIDDISVEGFGPLPVELASFTGAISSDREVTLSWTTATELNNAGFSVEKFGSGMWDDQGFVQGSGTTLEENNYNFVVGGLLPGVHKFRLRQLDLDGTENYSAEIEVNLEMPGSHVLTQAYPNPFNPTSQFSLVVKDEQDVSIVLYNSVGQKVQTLFDGFMRSYERQDIRIDGSALSSGTYYYVVQGGTLGRSTNSLMLLK